MSPTQRTIKRFKEEGYTVWIVEKWNHWAKIRQDLFGFIDILAMKQGEPLIGIQTCVTGDMSTREKKIMDSPNYPIWLSTGCRLVIIGWAKQGARGKRKVWTPKAREMLGFIGGGIGGTGK